jgi:hypothetical protein
MWFPKEDDLWVPSNKPGETLARHLLERIGSRSSHSMFAGDILVSVNPNHAAPSADEDARRCFGQLWGKVRASCRH